ncbi:hypothetical protein BDQ17DRAFT_1428771 [Cyathus striatus]|nr:hypothetical protein BDQ17DRAFT_1428771 [Cyathus striatus]
MNHQFDPRLVLHHRRGLAARQTKDTADDDDVEDDPLKIIVGATTTDATTTTTPLVVVKTTVSSTTAVSVTPSTTSSHVIPAVATPSTSAAVPSTSVGVAAPTSSSSIVVAAPPANTNAASSTSAIIPVAGTTSAPAVSNTSTTIRALSSISQPPAALQQRRRPSNGGAIAGGVVGGLIGFVALCAFVAFIVVRLFDIAHLFSLLIFLNSVTGARDNEPELDSANQFRRSALLLDDDKSTKASTISPRPPSMIERRAAATPAIPNAPSMAYGPHSDQPSQFGGSEFSHYSGSAAGTAGVQYGALAQQDPYGAAPGRYDVPGRYGTPNPGPYGGAPVGYNMPPQFEQYPALDPYASNVAAYGARPGYGGYGAPDPRFGHSATQQYSQYNNIPPAHQYDYGPNSGQSVAPQLQLQQNEDFANPFAAAAQAPSSPSNTSPTQEPYIHRQNSLAHSLAHDSEANDVPPPAYVDDVSYANVQRDVKVRPQLAVSNAGDDSTTATSSSSRPRNANANANDMRPVSSHTVYDPSDAYGGM